MSTLAPCGAAFVLSLCGFFQDAPPPDMGNAAPYPVQDVQVGVDGDSYADTDPSALTDFRATLDPHGQWVDEASYGTVWQPNAAEVGSNFYPYVTSGHWEYDDDYVWASDYDWGWVPFHYGRWVWINGLGWAWIPGRDYAGAWVDWRYGEGEWGYLGWAPLAPLWGWRGGVAVGLGYQTRSTYVYAPRGDVFSPAVGSRLVSAGQAGAIAPHTRPYTPATPTVGPSVHATPVHGPPPALLGIPSEAVVHTSSSERGLAFARAYARPSTAATFGATGPTPHLLRASPGANRGHAASAAPAGYARQPAQTAPAPRGGGARPGHR